VWSVGGRLWAAAAVCALVLAVLVAQPVASWSCASGAHVTVEQVRSTRKPWRTVTSTTTTAERTGSYRVRDLPNLR
jgi:hypothetical protein